MFEARFVAAVGQKPVDVLRDGVPVVAAPKAVEIPDYLRKLLVNRQREAPKLRRQSLLARWKFGDRLRRKKALIGFVGALQMTESPLVRRGIRDLAYEACSILPMQGNALTEAAGRVDFNRHRSHRIGRNGETSRTKAH